MIETRQEGGTGRVSIRSDVAGDVQGPDAEGFVTLSAEAVGEVVRIAATAPSTVPQSDARAILGGRRL